MRVYIFLIVLPLFIHEKEINSSEFNPYVQTFVEEGNIRGVHLDKEAARMEVRFGNLAEGTSGSCRKKGRKSYIIIDSQIWRRLDSLQRQALIFHEMGHCLLERQHTHEELPRGECASLMVEKRDTSTCYYNYYATEWRTYYWDELFAGKMKIPAWYYTDSTIRVPSNSSNPVLDTAFERAVFFPTFPIDISEEKNFQILLENLTSNKILVTIYWDELNILFNLHRKRFQLHINRRNSLGKMIPRIFERDLFVEHVDSIKLVYANGYYNIFLNEDQLYRTKRDFVAEMIRERRYANFTLSGKEGIKSQARLSVNVWETSKNKEKR